MTDVITDRGSALRSADPAGVARLEVERDLPDERPESLNSAPEAGDGRSWFRRFADYFVLPSIWTDPQPTLIEMRSYARTAPWTSQRSGFVRGVGVAYYRLVACPAAAVFRHAEWVCLRPARLLVVLGLLKLFSLSTPGSWLGQVLGAAGHGLAWILY